MATAYRAVLLDWMLTLVDYPPPAVERCEAHHILPWWERGDTDIDNLVLVCSRCHHDLHDRDEDLRLIA